MVRENAQQKYGLCSKRRDSIPIPQWSQHKGVGWRIGISCPAKA